MIRSDRCRVVVVFALAALADAGACGLPIFPDGEIACITGEGARRCPEGYSCVDPDGEGNRCFETGCGDGILNVNTEQCDDANDNELDRCTSACTVVDHVAVLDNVVGLGKGDGRARASPMGRPTAIVADLDGNVFVTSAGTNVLSRLSPIDVDGAGDFAVARVGGNGTMLGGTAGTTGVRPDTMSTTFATSLAVDGFGNLFLGDFQDSVIRRIDAVTGLVDAVAGTGVTVPSAEDDVAGTLVSLNLPTGLSIDGAGALFFAERGFVPAEQRIRRLDPDTGRVRTVFDADIGSATAPRVGTVTNGLEVFAGDIQDMVFDESGRLHVLTLGSVPRGGIVGHFVRVATFAINGDQPANAADVRSLFTHTTDSAGVDIPDLSALPGIGNDQGHMVTVDGDVFFVLMDTSVVRLDMTAGFGEVVAKAPAVDDSAGNTGAIVDGTGAAIPFSFKPTDLALVREFTDEERQTIYVADPGNGVVWGLDGKDEEHVLGQSDVVAGDRDPGIAVDTAELVGAVAVGFALESDGHVAVGATADCRPKSPLSLDAVDFMLAFPDAHRVLYSSCGDGVGILAGTGVAGFAGDGGRADAATLDGPTAMIRIDLGGDNDFFFIADRGNNRIRRLRNVALEGDRFELHIDTFIGGPPPPPPPAVPPPGASSAPGAAGGLQLDGATALAVDDTKALLIADTNNHRLLRVDISTGEVTTVAGTGEAGFNGDDLAAAATQLNEPVGLVFLPLGLVTSLTNPDAPQQACVSNDVCTDGKVCNNGFCAAPGGFLLVAERGGHRVRGIFLPPIRGFPEVITLAGDGVAGDINDNTDGRLGRLLSPRSLMFGIPDLNERRLTFLIVDAFDRLREMSLTVGLSADDFGLRTTLATLGSEGSGSRLDGPRKVATFRSPSAVAALDAERVLVVDRATGRLRVVPLGGSVVTVSGLSDGTPVGITPLPAASVVPLEGGADVVVQLDATPPTALVAESDAGRLRRFQLHDLADPSTWTTDVVPLDVDLVRPEGLALDGDDLYIADAGAHVVWQVSLRDGSGGVFAGTEGVRGSIGDGRAATSALLNAPAGVAVKDGVIIIADTGNNRVRRIDPLGDSAGTIRTILGDGAPALGGEGKPARLFPVRAPRGLVIDDAGNVIVTSGSGLRFIGAGDPNRRERQLGLPHVADGDDDVSTIYGTADREDAFPESVTRCLDDVTVVPTAGGPTVVTVDACVGLVLPLVRTRR